MSMRHHAPRTAKPANRRSAVPNSSLSATPPLARAGTQSGGQPLDRHTQARMSARFGHDFSQVRVHTDAEAGASAAALGANAFAHGSDVVFGEGQWTPGSPQTERLLAHELTHVAQQDRFGPGDTGRASDRGDEAEREADAAGVAVAAGRDVCVDAAPAAALARDAKDDQQARLALLRANPMLSQFVDMATPASADPWAGAALAPERPAHVPARHEATGSVMGGGMAGIGGPVMDTFSVADQRAAAAVIQKGEGYANGFVDWMEAGEQSATSWAARKADGIPVLEQVVGAGKALVDGETGILGGANRGAIGMAGGLATAAADPWDTARGLVATAEHSPMLPGYLNPVRDTHGLVNVATGTESWGEFRDSLDPLSMENERENLEFSANQLVAPYKQDWDRGKKADALGHAGFDLLSMVLPLGEFGAVGKEARSLAETGGDLGAVGVTEPPSGGGGGLAAGGTTEPPGGGGGGAYASGGPGPDNSAHNAALFERLKAQLSQEEILGAEPKGSALKGGSGHVRSLQVMEDRTVMVDGKPKVVPKKVEGLRQMNSLFPEEPRPDVPRKLKSNTDVAHSAPIYDQDRIAQDGRVYPLKGGSKLTQMPGGVNGSGGVMEYIVDELGSLVHQLFVPGGEVTGEVGGTPRTLTQEEIRNSKLP